MPGSASRPGAAGRAWECAWLMTSLPSLRLRGCAAPERLPRRSAAAAVRRAATAGGATGSTFCICRM